MRTYVVQEGDSPARIASRPDMAGCPKCSLEMPRANPGKPSITHPNGYVTFKDLRVGEVINLPDEWFHPARENLPATYYKILPHHNGVTRGSLGGALGDSSPELDTAVAKVAQLAAMGDAAFTQAVGAAGAAIDASVRGADAAQARVVTDATRWAWQRNRDLAAAVAANDRATVTRARLDIQNALATALGNVKLAILPAYPPELQAAAKAAAAAIAADPNYCTSVAHAGTPVNAAVHRFKRAWNASETPKVPVDTGNYETATTVALAQVLGQAPSTCSAGRPVPAPKPVPPSQKEEITPPTERGWSPWKIAAGVALGAVAASGVAWVASKSNHVPATRRGYA